MFLNDNLFFRYAQYSHFKIFSEGEYYKLEIDGYEGNAGDSLNDPWYGSNNSPFSTYNRLVKSFKNPLNRNFACIVCLKTSKNRIIIYFIVGTCLCSIIFI